MKHRNFERLKGTRKTNKSSRCVHNNPGSYREETDSYLCSVTETLSVSRGFPQYMQKDAGGAPKNSLPLIFFVFNYYSLVI